MTIYKFETAIVSVGRKRRKKNDSLTTINVESTNPSGIPSFLAPLSVMDALRANDIIELEFTDHDDHVSDLTVRKGGKLICENFTA